MSTIKKHPVEFASAGDFEAMQRALSELADKADAMGEDAEACVSAIREFCNETVISKRINGALRNCMEKNYVSMVEDLRLAREYDSKTGFKLRGRVWEAIKMCYQEAMVHNLENGRKLISESPLLTPTDREEVLMSFEFLKTSNQTT